MPTQRCRNFLDKLPDDEPAFTVRARDPIILDVIDTWMQRARQLGVPEAKILHVLSIKQDEVKPWQEEHGTRIPD